MYMYTGQSWRQSCPYLVEMMPAHKLARYCANPKYKILSSSKNTIINFYHFWDLPWVIAKLRLFSSSVPSSVEGTSHGTEDRVSEGGMLPSSPSTTTAHTSFRHGGGEGGVERYLIMCTANSNLQMMTRFSLCVFSSQLQFQWKMWQPMWSRELGGVTVWGDPIALL